VDYNPPSPLLRFYSHPPPISNTPPPVVFNGNKNTPTLPSHNLEQIFFEYPHQQSPSDGHAAVLIPFFPPFCQFKVPDAAPTNIRWVADSRHSNGSSSPVFVYHSLLVNALCSAFRPPGPSFSRHKLSALSKIAAIVPDTAICHREA